MAENPLIKHLTKAVILWIIAFGFCGTEPPEGSYGQTSPFWLPWKLLAFIPFFWGMNEFSKFQKKVKEINDDNQ